MPLEDLTVPISEFRIKSQEELVKTCSTIRQELKRFSIEHSLTQGILVTYSPVTSSEGKIKAEMCMGKKEIEELKQRMADLTLDQMLPVNLTNHLVILQDCVPTQLELEKVEEQDTKVLCLGALCIDRAVMRRKNTTEVEGEHVLTFPVKLDVL